ncbi:uncharacterized protein BO80DRAFT_231347 [Aspergillus ibericus CBS 121593]|uniref:Uncharacterized protein n=1 Tax=Aspergillus ibericus CBS 121593 TaxID=1448316 RepID=A0A395HDF7_9EURO|nr:hypothetical protein BO80DRAFT_231347 [Aspergillus ibericus CBS 121593]RAL04264.1 hypothetical protein BO80DRAFT_231347 [Aspergillus ibericus CBS 121593]
MHIRAMLWMSSTKYTVFGMTLACEYTLLFGFSLSLSLFNSFFTRTIHIQDFNISL